MAVRVVALVLALLPASALSLNLFGHEIGPTSLRGRAPSSESPECPAPDSSAVAAQQPVATTIKKLIDELRCLSSGALGRAQDAVPALGQPFDKLIRATAVDVKESEDAFVFTVDVPGINPGEIFVRVHDGVLTISGERKHEDEDQEHHRVERSFGAFARSFNLPPTADETSVKARVTSGVLEVKVAKHPPGKAAPKQGFVDVAFA